MISSQKWLLIATSVYVAGNSITRNSPSNRIQAVHSLTSVVRIPTTYPSLHRSLQILRHQDDRNRTVHALPPNGVNRSIHTSESCPLSHKRRIILCALSVPTHADPRFPQTESREPYHKTTITDYLPDPDSAQFRSARSHLKYARPP